MQEVLEKIIKRLEEEKTTAYNTYVRHEMNVDLGRSFGAEKAIEIVNRVASEHGDGWIPCSKRLPSKEEYLKNDGRFIVTDGNRVYQSIYDIYGSRFRTLRFFSNGGRDSSFEPDNCVVAWCPLPELPEPYKAESEG